MTADRLCTAIPRAVAAGPTLAKSKLGQVRSGSGSGQVRSGQFRVDGSKVSANVTCFVQKRLPINGPS